MKVHKVGKVVQPSNRKKPVSDKPKKKPYVPLYGTKDCTYEGKKKGRKTNEEREKYCILISLSKTIHYYFLLNFHLFLIYFLFETI